MEEQIYKLIGEAMKKVGAIGKDSAATNQSGKRMYMFRGVDAVYNALNPVLSELGLFICPEVLEQTREERKSTSGGTLIYAILKVKFTIYAPDGSNVSCVVVGEGMDSGDKASNKAMSVAFKYACFELLCIPTEEMVDPDGEVHDVAPGTKEPDRPNATQQEHIGNRQTPPADVSKTNTVPPVNKEQKTGNPVVDYLVAEKKALMEARRIDAAQNTAIWNKQIEVLRANKKISDKKLSSFTMKEAQDLVNYMYSLFDPTGTELKNVDGEIA